MEHRIFIEECKRIEQEYVTGKIDKARLLTRLVLQVQFYKQALKFQLPLQKLV